MVTMKLYYWYDYDLSGWFSTKDPAACVAYVTQRQAFKDVPVTLYPTPEAAQAAVEAAAGTS